MNDAVEALGKIFGRKLPVKLCPLPHDDPVRRRPDCTRARERLGWRAKATLEEGLRKTVEYFRGRLGKGGGT